MHSGVTCKRCAYKRKGQIQRNRMNNRNGGRRIANTVLRCPCGCGCKSVNTFPDD